MKRGIAVLLSVGAVMVAGYFTASKWAIKHESLTFYDTSRDSTCWLTKGPRAHRALCIRPVPVDVAVRRDKEMQADAGMLKLPVAVLNHGNTVKNTQYSFLANIFAARGYAAISVQNDLDTDPPMVTRAGELYVGRLKQIQRGVANIKFAVEEMEKVQPNADYDHLAVVGHSLGGDIAMYFAKQYPDQVTRLVTLDNLRVPFVTLGKFKTLSFRSHDPQFKTDPGVIPSQDICDKEGITVVKTEFQHNDMRDDGPEQAKESIRGMLDKFLADSGPEDSTPVAVSAQPKMTDPGPVAPYVPLANQPAKPKSLTQ